MTPHHPLVQRLADDGRATAVDAASAPLFAARIGAHALFFAGDPVRFGESLDVAVVLPELVAASGGRFDVGVVARDDEDAVARRWGVQRWPSLVFVREGAYLATVSGMHDWTDFVAATHAALDATPSRPPTVGIPVVAAGATASSCS